MSDHRKGPDDGAEPPAERPAGAGEPVEKQQWEDLQKEAKAKLETGRAGDDPDPNAVVEHADLRSPITWLPTVVETLVARSPSRS